MPSAAKTKSGKVFRAPTDQARKQDRRRENKKNKKDRLQIRQTIAKCCNVDECVEKMLGLDRQIMGLDGQQFHVDVLKKKQKTLMEMVDRRKIVLTKTKDEEGLKTLNEKLQHYYQDAARLRTLAVQERLARLANPESIPLPEGDQAVGDFRKVQLMGPHAALPAKKKVDFRLPRGGRGKGVPPGPPCGAPPQLSDSEGEDFGPDDDDLAPVLMPDFDAPPEPRYPRYPPSMPLRCAPGPPPMPPPPMFANPMGIPMAPRVHLHQEAAAIISSAPVIRREQHPPSIGPTPDAPIIVTAAPQLRNLRQETVKLVPVQLQRTRPTQPIRPRAVARPQTETHKAAKSTDDAYNDFMKELGDLI